MTTSSRSDILPGASDPALQPRLSAIARSRDDLVAVLDHAPAVIPDHGIIAGPATWDSGRDRQVLGHDPQRGVDNNHFPMSQGFLRLGYPGIADRAAAPRPGLSAEQSLYRAAIAAVFQAATRFVQRHADAASALAGRATGSDRERLTRIAAGCGALARGAPETFAEAVQLFWFTWRIRSAYGTATIGRLDQYLWPFYSRDLDAGRLGRAAAFDLLAELWERFNQAGSGDTLMNLMLGGQDRAGNDATTDLSVLMLDVAVAVHRTEPHVNVRLHPGTPAAFVDRLVDLQLLGHGQGTVYSDDALIPSLVRHGVPPEAARSYANDGCTEVVIDGESGIEFTHVEALKALELTLFNGRENTLPGVAEGYYWTRHAGPRRLATSLALGFESGDVTQMTSFAEVYDAFLRQYLFQVDRKLADLSAAIRRRRDQAVSSLFLAGLYPAVLDCGDDPFRGGFTQDCFMLFSGSLPTVADGLAAIRQVVFDDRACSMAELLDALRADFAGWEPLRLRLLAAPKFGNDDDRVDLLAADLAVRFCERVRSTLSPTGKPYWPALYDYLFNDHAKIVGATPDGRRWRDPVAEHYSPTPGRARSGPTAVIRSATKGPLAAACGAAPFHLSLSRGSVPRGAAGAAVLGNLLRTALRLGAATVNVAIYDVDQLRRAKAHPEQYGDVIVRVWGYSARFVDLADDMQDHVIARAIEDPGQA